MNFETILDVFFDEYEFEEETIGRDEEISSYIKTNLYGDMFIHVTKCS